MWSDHPKSWVPTICLSLSASTKAWSVRNVRKKEKGMSSNDIMIWSFWRYLEVEVGYLSSREPKQGEGRGRGADGKWQFSPGVFGLGQLWGVGSCCGGGCQLEEGEEWMMGGEGYKGEWTPSKHLNKDYFRTPGEKYRILPQRSEEEFDLESLQRLGACAPVCKYPDGIWPSSKQRGEKSDQILGKSGFEIQPQLLFSSHTLLSSNSKQWPSLELP